MLNPTIAGATTRAQIEDTDEAVLRFVVTGRRPDLDVHPGDVARWVALEQRSEIRRDLRASGLL